MIKAKTIGAIASAVVVTWFAVVAFAQGPHIGPAYDGFPLTLSAGHRTEIAGPLYYSETKETQTQWAMPPLWSDTVDSATDSKEFDLLYPLLTYDRFGTEYRFQIFQVFNFCGGQNQQANATRRFTLFPIYFQQRSPDTNLNYTALFPFYGRLQNRPLNMRDEIRFALFPFYAETRKRDVVTENYLFPFFHVRHGNGLTGWQAWPLIGHEQKNLTDKTNLFDTVEAVGGHDKWFALWPFYFKNHTGLGTTNSASELAVLPAYDRYSSAQRDSTSILWPFFSYIDDHEKKYHEWQTPYPFIVFARGEGKTTSRIWPFFGVSHSPLQSSDFYAWPIYQHKHLRADPLDRDRRRIFFFLYSDLVEKNTETEKARKRVDLFPFFTWHHDFNGDTRLQILAPVEPFLPNNKSIERNYSPLWSVWRAERSGECGAESQSLLWNLYRRDLNPAGENISLLFGLFRYQSAGDGANWSLFHFPLGKTNPAEPSVGHFQPLPEAPPHRPAGLEHPDYDAVQMTK